jgi:transposase
MCDALSRNTPKVTNGVKILLANCMTHGRRQFVNVAPNFPQECGFVLESLGMVYANEALIREQDLDAEERLRFHQQYSGPLLDQLHDWLEEGVALILDIDLRLREQPSVADEVSILLRAPNGH